MSYQVHDEDREMGLNACPWCGHVVNATSQIAERGRLEVDAPKPQPGDLAVCIRCGGMQIFDTEFRLAKLETPQFLALPADEQALLLNAQAAARALPSRAN